jgi:hypothetical protein
MNSGSRGWVSERYTSEDGSALREVEKIGLGLAAVVMEKPLEVLKL